MASMEGLSIPPPGAVSFAAALLLCAALNFFSLLPMVPIDTTVANANDRMFAGTGGFRNLAMYRAAATLLFVYQAVVACFLDNPAVGTICPRVDNLDVSLFTWNPVSTVLVLLMIVGFSTRLVSIGTLGSSFTFAITKPKNGLVTTGMYAYVQHPSYSTYFIGTLGQMPLTWRVRGVPGCWFEPSNATSLLQWVLIVTYFCLQSYSFGIRVRDEERFLKKQFGKEWEAWNRKTARFIPGIF